MKNSVFYDYSIFTLIATIFAYTAMEIINIIFMDSTINLLLTIPQLGFIAFLIIKGDVRKAFLFHMIFIALSFDYTSVLNAGTALSYGKIKFLGPISFMHIMMGFFFVIVQFKYSIKETNTMIYKAYKIMLKIFCIGVLVGAIGFLFNPNYSFDGFLDPFVYMVTGLMHLNIMIRLYNRDYVKLFFVNAWILLQASVLATLITYHLGYTADYSVEKVYLYNEFYYLAPCLLISLLQLKDNPIIVTTLLSLVFFMYNAISGGSRGSTFVTLFAALLMFIYTLYTLKRTNNIINIMKTAIPFIVGLGLPSIIVFFLNTDGLTGIKFKQFLSVFSLMDFSSDFYSNLSFVSTSPYIRISELINIVDNYIYDFISIPFGRGYGGYYTDSTGLFNSVDLTIGAFSHDIVAKGKFPSAHSVYPNALLYNGFIGLYLILKLGIQYVKKANVSYLCFAGFVLFCYSLYYNPLMFLACIFCLYAAEYQLKPKSDIVTSSK